MRIDAMAVVVVTLSLAACGSEDRGSGDPVLWTQADVRGARVFRSIQWDSLWTVGGPADSLMLMPQRFIATEDGVYVYERGINRIVALSPQGAVRWTRGKRGQGPNEFREVRDLQVDSRGRLWILDPGNRRITGLSPSGETIRRVPIRIDGRAEWFAPLPDGGFLLFTHSSAEPVVRVSPDGDPVERFDLAWEGFNRLSPIQRQGLVVADGDRAAYLFSMGNGWFPIEDGGSTRVERYVEHAPFPRIVRMRSGNTVQEMIAERSPCFACSGYLSGDTLTVHAGGTTGAHHALLDRYDWDTGDYLGSVQLPVRSSMVAAAGPQLYLLNLNPYPHITAYRFQPHRAAVGGTSGAVPLP